MNILMDVVSTGVCATLVTDIWGFARKPLLGVASPDYGLVGRWVGHMPRGKVWHRSITAAKPVGGERLLGWFVHYSIGIAFAALLFGIVGHDWLRQPTLAPALLTGIGTVAAPFLLLQPAMGLGIAASRTPRPAAARLQSLLMHLVFGFGLYVAGWGLHLVHA